MPETDWDDILRVWLHDPFDKALAVKGHESRAALYTKATGCDVSRRGQHGLAAQADMMAAIAERVPMPTAGAKGERAVGPEDGLRIVHPASGTDAKLTLCSLDPAQAVGVIEKTVCGLTEPRERFLAIWRLLPDAIAEEFGDDAARLPADTRVPDHTLFQHADITAGMHAAKNSGDAAFLSFALGPVQPFIEAARSVRDLWSGSALLSWLAFQAMKPILERLGPTAFVFPALRGAALMDLWLRKEAGLGERVPSPKSQSLRAPSLPHRFVAVVPWGEEGVVAEEFRRACVEAAQGGWRRLADEVRTRINPRMSRFHQNWDRFWDLQIENALEFRAAVVPERELHDDQLARLTGKKNFSLAWPEAQKVRELDEAIPYDHRPSYVQNNAGRWQAQMEISARLMAAERAVRHVPETKGIEAGDGPVPAKCTLFGSWEQMGPADLSESRKFWEEVAKYVSVGGVRIRPRERLCAVALTKRFAGPALLASELDVSAAKLRFPDTPTVAAGDWLARAGIDPEKERGRGNRYWSGLWLHWRKQDEKDKDEETKPDNDLWHRICEARKRQRGPSVYYAVIAMDGDEMGGWLAGEKIPELRELLHPKLRDYFMGLKDTRADAGLSARRPVGPALHAAISAALSTFASEVAPLIVAENLGTMIYSGGDDLLALCPAASALRCANALRDAFSGRDDAMGDGWRACGGRRRITMGGRASMSAGIAVVHYHDDLRIALETARDAQDRAKKAGRDRLCLVTARRSGETASALCPWQCVPWFDELRKKFFGGASDRWAYRLRAELPTLASDSLPVSAMRAEIRRLVARSREDNEGLDGDEAAAAFDRYCDARGEGARDEALRDFVILSQSAAFMARGGDG